MATRPRIGDLHVLPPARIAGPGLLVRRSPSLLTMMPSGGYSGTHTDKYGMLVSVHNSDAGKGMRARRLLSFVLGVIGFAITAAIAGSTASRDLRVQMFYVSLVFLSLIGRGVAVFFAWHRMGHGPRHSSPTGRPHPKHGATLVVTRGGGFWKDRVRSYRVLVDGEPVGSVYEYDSLTVPIQPGYRLVQAKVDFFRSRDLVLSVGPGETKNVVVAAGQVDGLPDSSGYLKIWEGELDGVCPPAVGT